MQKTVRRLQRLLKPGQQAHSRRGTDEAPLEATDLVSDTSAKELSVFEHDPIDTSSGEIRVFHLLHEEEGIQLSLVHGNPCGRHTAISYVCGDPDAERCIQINGKSYNIRANLYDFLCELKRRRRDDRFWADCIGLNQSDITEKNLQVRQMHQIYRDAREVSLWLGPSNSAIDQLLQFLHSLGPVPHGNYLDDHCDCDSD